MYLVGIDERIAPGSGRTASSRRSRVGGRKGGGRLAHHVGLVRRAKQSGLYLDRVRATIVVVISEGR